MITLCIEQPGQRIQQPIDIVRRIIRLNRNADKGLVLPRNNRHLDAKLIIQTSLEGCGIAGWQRGRDHLHIPVGRVWADVRQSGQFADSGACLLRQGMALQSDFVPVMLCEKLETFRHRQVRRGITRAIELLFVDKLRGAWAVGFIAP